MNISRKIFVMSKIGIATCVGFGIAIPYLVRCLADSLALVNPEELPIHIDDKLWEWMGRWPYSHDQQHEMAWWTTKTAHRIEGYRLNDSTLAVCLERYRRDCLEPDGGSEKSNSPSPIIDIPEDLETERCVYCRVSKTMLADAAAKLQQAHVIANTHKTINEAEAEMGRRKMGTAYLLTEMVLSKETAAKGPQVELGVSLPAPPVNPHSQWAFGQTLTPKDILAKFGAKVHGKRGFTRGKHHSGYYKELPDGNFDDDAYFSDDPEHDLLDIGTFSTVAGSAKRIPPSTNNDIPSPLKQKYRWTSGTKKDAGGTKEHSEAMERMFGAATIQPEDAETLVPPRFSGSRSGGRSSVHAAPTTIPEPVQVVNATEDDDDSDEMYMPDQAALRQMVPDADDEYETDSDDEYDGPDASALVGMMPDTLDEDNIDESNPRSARDSTAIDLAHVDLSEELFNMTDFSDDEELM